MNPKDNNELNNLYYLTNDGTWHKIDELSSTMSITCNITEEDAAKLWAIIEGLEIVPNDD